MITDTQITGKKSLGASEAGISLSLSMKYRDGSWENEAFVLISVFMIDGWFGLPIGRLPSGKCMVHPSTDGIWVVRGTDS
jgi:hypothetical protein